MLLVLRGVRRIDEACVDDPPRGQPQAGIKELLVDHFKDLRAKLMLLKQMPELQDRGLIKRAVHQVQADELSRSRVLEEEILHARITQVVRCLKQMYAKHQVQQGVPGNELVEPLRQAFHMSLARLAAKTSFKVCEGELFHSMLRLSYI